MIKHRDRAALLFVLLLQFAVANLIPSNAFAGVKVNEFRKVRPDLHPSPFVHHEVVPQVAPLKVCDYGVYNRENISSNFKARFPPIKGLISLFWGAWLLFWGWPNMKIERHLPTSGICFVIGICLIFYGWIVLLPWSVDKF